MPFKHINCVRDHSKAKGKAKFLLLTIATYCNDDGICFPSNKCLAQDTGIRPSHISRYLKEIPPYELIIVQKGGSQKGQKRQHTIYRIPDCSHIGDSQKLTITKNVAYRSHNGKSTVPKIDGDCSHRSNLTANKQPLEQPKKQPAFSPFELTDELIKELQREFGGRRDIRLRHKEALVRCAELYPGQPMGLPWFREFLSREPMHPADPEGYAAQKRADLAEARLDRKEYVPPSAADLKEFERQHLRQHVIPGQERST